MCYTVVLLLLLGTSSAKKERLKPMTALLSTTSDIGSKRGILARPASIFSQAEGDSKSSALGRLLWKP